MKVATQNSSRGFTLVELLVVIAIIAILCMTILPAIQASREFARRNNCVSNLSRVILSMQEYESANVVYPAGVTDSTGPIRHEPKGMHHSWTLPILPYLDEPAAARAFDANAGVYADANAALRAYVVSVYACPSDRRQGAYSSYAGVQDDRETPIDAENHGVFFLNSHLRHDELSDGAGHTLFLGEKRIADDELSWLSGTRDTLRNLGTSLNAVDKIPPVQNAIVGVDAEVAAGAHAPPDDLFANSTPPQAKTPHAPVTKPQPPAGEPPLFVGGFSSRHAPGIVVFALGDGQVRPIRDQVDDAVMQKLAHRSDGALVSLDDIE